MSEQLAAKFRAELLASDSAPKGTRESLKKTAWLLNLYAVDCFPANENGQVHFVRAIMESAADEITAFLQATEANETSLPPLVAVGPQAGD